MTSPTDIITSLPGYDPFEDSDGYEFDPERARPYIVFCQAHLTHVKGRLKGKPYILEPHELALWYNVFGWYSTLDGTRRFREVLYYIPRKQSKSTNIACMSNAVLFVDDEKGMENYSCGADRDQASIVRNICTAQVQADPDLLKRVKIYHTTRAIELKADGSIYRALSADAHTKHGLNAHFVVCDEIHAYPNGELIDVMKTSMGARQQPMIVYTTTADFMRESPCNEILAYAKRVRDGDISDPTLLPVIYEITKQQLDADPDAWKKPKYWYMANPNLGKSVPESFLEKECRRAVAEPSFENTFKRLYLNIQTETSERMISSDVWVRNDGPLEFEGRVVVGAGLDLGSTMDMCSLCLLFDRDGGGFDAKWWHWIPRAKALEYERKRGWQFSVWEREGWIELTEGNEIDYNYMEECLLSINDQWMIPKLFADRRFQGAQICQRLIQHGWDVETFNCSFLNMTAPTEEFLRLLARGEFGHGDNPVMRWQASNVIALRNSTDLVRPGKAESDGKIDGIVTAIIGLAAATAARQNTTSVYESRGLLEFGVRNDD